MIGRSETAVVSIGFRLGAGALLGIWILASFWLASLEWFSRDDFAFLALVRSPEAWSWSELFWPVGERFWPFYRPLAMESYFRLSHAAFGLEAFGYFAVSLGVHFASGALVYRIARQLGQGSGVAFVVAFLSVSRHPSLDEIFYGSVFHFVISVFFVLLAVTAYLDGVERRSRVALCLSALAQALALLCNEVNVLIPLLALSAQWARDPRRFASARSLRATLTPLLPHAILIAVYLPIRFGVFAEVQRSPLYTPFLGEHVARNAAGNLAFVFQGGTGPWLAALAVVGWGVLGAAMRADQRGALLRRATGLIAWCALAVGPFALLPYSQVRYGIMLEAPLCLLMGAFLAAGWNWLGRTHWGRAEALALAVCLVSLPRVTFAERMEEPRGVYALRLLDCIEGHPDVLEKGGRVVVLYGAQGLASQATTTRYRILVYNLTVVAAVHPEVPLSLRFHDLSRRSERSVIRPGSVYLELRPDLSVHPAQQSLLDRELDRGGPEGGW